VRGSAAFLGEGDLVSQGADTLGLGVGREAKVSVRNGNLWKEREEGEGLSDGKENSESLKVLANAIVEC